MSLDRLKVVKATNAQAWGAGLIAMDIIEAEESNFAAAGGSCGNVMAILSWFGWTSMPVARFGSDVAGDFVRAEFEDLGIETNFVSCEPRVDTPIVIQRFATDKDGQRVHRFSLTCPECGSWLPRHRPITLRQAASIAESTSRPKAYYFDRVSPGAIRLAEMAREEGALVVFEPASVGDEAKFQRAVDLCHVLKYSHERLGKLPDLAVAPSPSLIIETQGEAGLRFRWKNKWTSLDAIKTENPLDAAGSGDWCTAALIHSIGQKGYSGLFEASNSGIVKALRTGQALASINCQYYGARGAMMVLSLRQVNQHLVKLGGQSSSLNVEDSGALIGSEPPEFCRRCEVEVTSNQGNKRAK